jgi:hypothetical protein
MKNTSLCTSLEETPSLEWHQKKLFIQAEELLKSSKRIARLASIKLHAICSSEASWLWTLDKDQGQHSEEP